MNSSKGGKCNSFLMNDGNFKLIPNTFYAMFVYNWYAIVDNKEKIHCYNNIVDRAVSTKAFQCSDDLALTY